MLRGVARSFSLLGVLALFTIATGCSPIVLQREHADQGQQAETDADAYQHLGVLGIGVPDSRILDVIRNAPEFKAIAHSLAHPKPTQITTLGDELVGVTFDLSDPVVQDRDLRVYSYVLFLVDISRQEVIEVVTGIPDLQVMEVELKFSRVPANDKRVKMSHTVIEEIDKLRQARESGYSRPKGEEYLRCPKGVCYYCSCVEYVPGHYDQICLNGCLTACYLACLNQGYACAAPCAAFC